MTSSPSASAPALPVPAIYAPGLVLADGLAAASAAHRVGDEGPSQFSREYRRLDVGQLRGGG